MVTWSLALREYQSKLLGTSFKDDEAKITPQDEPEVAARKPKPALRGLTLEELEKLRSYGDVAKSVGFRPAELILVELYDFIEKNRWPVFNYNEVRDYLNSKRPKGIKYWCWRPLRAKDEIKGYRWGCDNGGDPTSSGYYRNSLWECRPYESLVPRHALEKVEKIALRFDEDVKFFVSDFAVPDLDPFIMVRPTPCDSGSGNRNYKVIFDMWDEPGFGA